MLLKWGDALQKDERRSMDEDQYQTPIPVLIARARILREKHLASEKRETSPFYAAHEKESTTKPTREPQHLFSPVIELFIAGGGGAGRALPQALQEAVNFGLDLKKIKVICATSVGTIVGLGLTLGITPANMRQMLEDMPTEKFQDWSLRKIVNFFYEWGLCSGKEMTAYLRKLIKEKSGLDDPTFLELYRAGFKKEFRVVVTNVSKQRISIFSYKETPHIKVSEAVATACGIPLVYPPHWIVNAQGELEAFTDGGLIRNYPFGVGGSPNVPLEKQLGFNFVNRGAAYSLNNDKHALLGSFWAYLRTLFSMILFQDPLSLSDAIKNRTVVINVNHNPLKFNATAEEQRALDEAGQNGVRHLVHQIMKIKKKQDVTYSHPMFLPAYSIKRSTPIADYIETRKAKRDCHIRMLRTK